MGGWSRFGKGLLRVGKFLYENPEVISVVANAASGKEVAKDISTVVEAKQPAEVAPAPVTQAQEPAPVAPAPAPGPQPIPDLIGKWKGLLDQMSMNTLGYTMAADELYNNAQLLEKGDVAGVQRNLDAKK